MHRLFTMFILALLTVSAARGEDSDSLQIFLQRGDSLMEQYNTYEALNYYQQAYDRAQAQGVTRFSMNDDFSHSRPYVPEEHAGGQPHARRFPITPTSIATCYNNMWVSSLSNKNPPKGMVIHKYFVPLPTN